MYEIKVMTKEVNGMRWEEAKNDKKIIDLFLLFAQNGYVCFIRNRPKILYSREKCNNIAKKRAISASPQFNSTYWSMTTPHTTNKKSALAGWTKS